MSRPPATISGQLRNIRDACLESAEAPIFFAFLELDGPYPGLYCKKGDGIDLTIKGPELVAAALSIGNGGSAVITGSITGPTGAATFGRTMMVQQIEPCHAPPAPAPAARCRHRRR